MTKPVQTINDYWLKEIILNGNPDLNKFYKDDLIKMINILKYENQKYKEVIDNLKDKLMEYFEVGRDSYFYVLTRDKSAFDYGTMSFDDFIEFSEEQVDDIIDFLKNISCGVREDEN